MSRKIELVFAAFFALFFIGWLTFDIPVALGFVYKRDRLVRARDRPDLPRSATSSQN